MLKNHRLLGRWGERYALKYLKGKGYTPLAANFRTKNNEVDLIVRSCEGVIVFVEVKTRSVREYIPAKRAVNNKKKMKILAAARFFASKYGLKNEPQRFDIITILLPRKGKPILKHYPKAFRRF